eukprot:CAMPEP_0179008838 /NCGR_PEP_ID=MMETSP0795-20121207/15944_1 /TAXON_ID=88552 /ORGANISM="Amoebophrya sp., Strain Ameob2" /LENGTH=1250 /DNA_ID=CAMNT_0020703979 /DNA_START=94 /DNA_END=3846 /DNA_ORIENTATION=+
MPSTEDVAGRHSPSPPPATAESSATPFRPLPVPPDSSGSGVGVAEAATTNTNRPTSTTASCSATKMKIRVRAPQTEAEESEWREFYDLVVEILLEQTDQRLMFAKLRPLVNARKLEGRYYPPRPYAKFRHFFGDVVAFFNKKERCSDKVIELASTAGGSEPVVCLRSTVVSSSSTRTPNNRVELGAGGDKSCDAAFTSGNSYAQQSSHENRGRNSSSASSSSASCSETSSRSQKKKPGTGSGSSNKQVDEDANAQTKKDAAAHDRRKSKAGRPSKKIKRKRAEEQRVESESPSGAEAGRGMVEQLARPLHQQARKRGTSKADITSSSSKPPGKVGGKTTSTSSKNKSRDPPPPSSAYEYPSQSANKGRGKTQRQHTWHAASWGAPPQLQTHADSTRSYSSTYAASYQHGHGATLGGGSSFLPHPPPTPASYHDGVDARSFIPRTAQHDHGDGAAAAVAADAQPVREGDANFSYESAVYYAPDGNVYGFFPLMVQQQPVAPDGHAAQHEGNVNTTTTAHNENQLNGPSELSTLTLSQMYLQHQQHHVLAGSNHDHVGAASMQAAGGAFFTGTDGASNEAEISSFASSPGLFVPPTGGGTGATGGLLAQTVRSQQSQSSAITSSPNFMGMLLPENFEQHTPGGPATSSPGALNFAPAERQTTNTKPNSFLSSAALEFVPAKEAVGVSSSNSAHAVVARPSLQSTSKPSGEVDEAATAVAVQMNGKTNEHDLLVRAKSVNVVADCEEKEVANVSSSSSSSPAGGGRARASAPPTSTPASPSRIPSEREGTPEDGANEEMTPANSPQQKQRECQEAQLIQLQVQVNQLQEQLKCLGAQNQSLDRNCKTLELKFEASSYSEARLSNQLRKQKIENAELKKRLAVFNQKAHETYIKSLADANWWNAHISSASTDTDTPAGGGSPSPTTTSDGAGAPVAPSSAVNGLGNHGGRGGNGSHSHQTQLIALHLPNAVSGGGGAPVLSSPLHVGPPLGMAISPVAEVDAEDNLNASNSGGSSVTGTGGGAGAAPTAPDGGGGSHHGQQGGGNNVMPIGTLSLNSKATGGGAPPSAGGSSSSSSTGGATVRNLLSAATLGALPLTLPSNATSSSSSPPGAGAQHQGGPHGVPTSGGPPAAHGGTTTNIVPHSTNHEFQHQMVFAHPVLKSSVPPSVSVHSFDFRSAQTSGASSTATFLSGQHTPRFFPAGAMGGVVTPGGISSGGTTGAAIGTLGGTIMQVRDDRIIIPQGIVQQKKGHFSK